MNKTLFFFKKGVAVDVDDTQVMDIQIDFEFFDEDILLEDVSAHYGGVEIIGLRPASAGELVAYQNGYSDAVRNLGN
jgi:hypothetical protein